MDKVFVVPINKKNHKSFDFISLNNCVTPFISLQFLTPITVPWRDLKIFGDFHGMFLNRNEYYKNMFHLSKARKLKP